MALTYGESGVILANGQISDPNASASLDQLTSNVAEYLARSDINEFIPFFVRMAEAKFNRKLREAGFETRIQLTPVDGVIALPSDYAEWRALNDVQSGAPIPFVTPEALETMTPRSGGAQARAFTIVGRTMRFAPVGAGPVTLVYYRGVGNLTVGGSNWLLERHPDLYLYAVLAEAQLFLQDDAAAGKWQAMAEGAMTTLVSADRSARWGRAQIRLSGPTP